MREQIIAALSPEERDILAPHMDRLVAADRELLEARRVLLLAATRLFPVMKEEGVTFDTERGVLCRTAPEEARDDT